MEDKIEEVVSQYSIQVQGRKKVRGAILLDTRQGQMLLRNYRGNKKRLEAEAQITQGLLQQGYLLVDFLVPNENGDLYSKDSMGDWWVLRQWHGGKECDMHDRTQVCQAVAHLAQLHSVLQQGNRWQQELQAADIEEVVENRQKIAMPGVTIFEKRGRELKRIYNYIRGKRKKNEMELMILSEYSRYYAQALEAVQLDAQQHNLRTLQEESIRQGTVIHGSYNYHNVLFKGKDIVTTNFGNARVGVQMMDLYGFLRKTMEKNGWNVEFGKEMITAYQEQRGLSAQERLLLYTLLLFPEKYWKQCNFYYNGKKCWVCGKNFEKLVKMQKQESIRKNFLEEIRGYLLCFS